MPMKIGFTGTRVGMTPKQEKEIAHLLRAQSELHHGDCSGADYQAHLIALRLNVPKIVIHPPTDDKLRAHCERYKVENTSVVVKPAADFLVRDKDIVLACEMLIAAPSTFKEKRRSGTWTTLRYAREAGCPWVLVYPDGRTAHS
jgi:hypothetical protein